jgi:outer membrane receptor protein involved in Fe transport
MQLSIPVMREMKLAAEAVIVFSDGYYTDGTLDQAGYQSAWTKIDFRLALMSAGDRWGISVVGHNLTNKQVLSGFQPAIIYPVGFYADPRTVRISLNYHFGT